jgi:hypothetical protein
MHGEHNLDSNKTKLKNVMKLTFFQWRIFLCIQKEDLKILFYSFGTDIVEAIAVNGGSKQVFACRSIEFEEIQEVKGPIGSALLTSDQVFWRHVVSGCLVVVLV